MKIIVPIKQIPKSNNVKIDPVTHNLVRNRNNRLNPYDRNAIELALQVAQKLGDTVTVITMGPPFAMDVLYEGLAMGADDAILLSDRKFGGADTLATGYLLSQAIKKIGLEQIRLVILGSQALDADTGQVGPIISSNLSIPQFTYIEEIVDFDAGKITAVRNLGDWKQTACVTFPALLTVSGKANQPRYMKPSLIAALSEKKITTWTANDIQLDETRIGLAGSPSKVRKSLEPVKSVRKAESLGATEDEVVDKILALLKGEN